MSFDKTKCVHFGFTALVGTNKVGLLKQDSDGYIDGLSVGALNTFNAKGDFYVGDCQEVLDLFHEGSYFMRQVRDGRCKAENGHPSPMPGESYENFAIRWGRINEARVCAHHANIYLGKSTVKAPNGANLIPIFSRTKPNGELGYVLEQDLKSPEINICFSMRGATEDITSSLGINHKYVRELYAYDKVNDPGIPSAKRWNSIALEHDGRMVVPASSKGEINITADIEMLNRISREMNKSTLTGESHGSLMNIGQLAKCLGYQHNPNMNSARGWRGWLNDQLR
jgi:hypothetical protein